jgi:hypothetical protein
VHTDSLYLLKRKKNFFCNNNLLIRFVRMGKAGDVLLAFAGLAALSGVGYAIYIYFDGQQMRQQQEFQALLLQQQNELEESLAIAKAQADVEASRAAVQLGREQDVANTAADRLAAQEKLGVAQEKQQNIAEHVLGVTTQETQQIFAGMRDALGGLF